MLLNIYKWVVSEVYNMAVEQNVIAIMYDCDLTLTPVYMQEVLFEHFNVSGGEFWRQNDLWQEEIEKQGVNFDDECVYMNSMLKYTREGKFAGLSNGLLRELGAQMELFKGLPEFFSRMKEVVCDTEGFRKADIKLEHYIISTGMKETIMGSALGLVVNGVFASEFYEEDGVIAGIARTVGYAKKTEYIHLINKGGNIDSRIDVNSKVDDCDRRVPFTQMIYVGDGPTDVPCFATLNHKGGKSIAVYHPTQEKAFSQCYQLQEEGRVFAFGPADYRSGSHISNVLELTIRQMADGIVERRERERTGKIRGAVKL